MSRALVFLMVLIAAFLVLVGALGAFAGIAAAFPTTEEEYFKIGVELKGAVLAVVGAAVVAAGLFLTRYAGRIYR